MSCKYKLHYLNVRARGELARMIFAAAGQKFEDIRIEFKDWPKIKPTMPTGQVPLLEMDGQKLTQSNAISLLLAKKFGFAGKTDIDQAYVNEVVFKVVDILDLYIKFYLESDETKKANLRKSLFEETAPKILNELNALLEKKKKTAKGGYRYFVGDSLTIADMFVYDILETLQKAEASILDKYPTLLEIRKTVESHEKLGKYLKSRPDSVV